MLVLELIPGVSLGPFTLGCLINDVLRTARHNAQVYGCVELRYYSQASPTQDVLLNLPEYGLHLFFDGVTQRLRVIEVYDLTRVQVRQGMATVGGSGHPATFDALYDLAGPTYPGHVDAEHDCYVMHWPALLAVFPATDAQAAMQQGRAAPGALGNATAPAATRLCIFAGSAVGLTELAQVKPPATSRHANALTSPLQIVIGKGIALPDSQQQLCFGDTPQDAWSALGAPSGTFSKQSPTPNPASARPGSPPTPHSQTAGSASDYFYNYFARGLDLLFDGQTHRMKKIVLHTNVHDHASFGVYNRCHFNLPKQEPDTQRQSGSESAQQYTEDDTELGLNQSNAQLQQQLQHGSRDMQGHNMHLGTELQQQHHHKWPVQNWLSNAGAADRASSDSGPSGSAVPSVQQALLNDIVAMARADSGDSDSSSISQQTHTHTHPPANQDLSPLSHMPTRHDTGQDGPENASSRSQAAEAPTHLAGINSVRHTAAHPAQLAFEDSTDWGVGEADGAMLDGWEGQSAVPRASHFDSWDGQSQAARASPMDGWDDMDPMAMLSQSAQLPSEAQLSKQSDSSSGNVPSSPPAAQGGGMRSTAVSDDGSQAIHSYPVSVHASHTPSSVATLLPLQPSPISRPQPSSTVADHDEGQGTSLDSPHDAAATEAYTGQVSILCQTAPVLTAASCWSDFEQHLGGGCQAMMHSRGGGAPFGPTTVHGFPGIVFEVTQAGHVATVTLFKV